MDTISLSLGITRRVLLVDAVVTLLGIASNQAIAATVPVMNCNDSGSGSLRDAVGSLAASGDLVDMSSLSCGTISLTTGAINVAQETLNFLGPGVNALTIAARYQSDRVFNHTGTGQLGFAGINIADGSYVKNTLAATAHGGCIVSSGVVFLSVSRVAGCKVASYGVGGTAAGGGIYAALGVDLVNSVIANNAAVGAFTSQGGGMASTETILQSSEVSGNKAAFGGGIFASGTQDAQFWVNSSTISGNTATQSGGGIVIESFPSSSFVGIGNSTIANNSMVGTASADQAGGIYISNSPIAFDNSTIAFNSSTNGTGGVLVHSQIGSYAAEFQSTIISNNVVQGSARDLTVSGNSTIQNSANNLVFSVQGSLPPSFGLPTGTCPLLAPLADNGGPTQTAALHTSSPAISSGNNKAGFTTDQRGAGYPRTRTGSLNLQFTDIGAYQTQFGDVIFNAGFDGCP